MNYDTNKKEVIVFRKTIPAGTDETIKERVKANGTIEGVRVRFYPGQQLDLRVNPYVMHKGQKIENMLSFPEGTNRYLTGDDDEFNFSVVIGVEYDDEIHVWVQNTDTVNDYDVVCDVTIDYYGGQNRVV